MAVPKRRTTRSKRDMRRSANSKVTAPQLVACPNCADSMVPHRVCPSCGHYKGREVVKKEDAEAAG